MSFQLGLLAAALGGFLALSCEILWFRVYSFVTGGTASGFGVLLGAYLAGLAFGSLWSRRACPDQPTEKHLQLPGILALVGNVLAFLMIPAVATMVAWKINYAFTLPLVALVAGVMGALLPLLSHLGIRPDDKAGRRLAYLYLANIVGSGAGSLLTGFVLLDHLSLQGAAVLLAVLGAALAVLLLAGIPLPKSMRSRWLAASLAFAVAAPVLAGPLYDRTYEKLQFKGKYTGAHFGHVIETRSGVITVTQDGAIFGGGMYDGVFSTDLVHDRNRIHRAYAVAAMHPAPRQVLMVGLASGSWAQVIAHMPGVEKLTVVEINPGYLELIRRFPEVRSLLDNPKVEIVIDDGRRWLIANKHRKFDVVVQNTTWHWRGQITGLLSTEYLTIVKERLSPGGVAFWNTTDSMHAQKAGCVTFQHGMRFANFLAASDAPLRLDGERWRQALLAWQIDGKPVLDLGNPAHQKRLDEMLAWTRPDAPHGPDAFLERCDTILERCKDGPPVTDDNMVSEFARPWYKEPE